VPWAFVFSSLLVLLARAFPAIGAETPYLRSCGQYEAVGRLKCQLPSSPPINTASPMNCDIVVFEGSAAQTEIHFSVASPIFATYQNQNVKMGLRLRSIQLPLAATPESSDIHLALATSTLNDLRLLQAQPCGEVKK